MFMYHTYCIGSISECHPVFNGNGKKASMELKGSSIKNMKGIVAISNKGMMLTMAMVKVKVLLVSSKK